ncbi:MAG: ABC transporter substrate-binding protein [Nitrospinota bacterium]
MGRNGRLCRFGGGGLALGLGLLALVGCGGGDSGAGRPVVILLGVDANKLDPHFITSTVELGLVQNVFDALLFRNDRMELEPALATSWEVDETGTVWTFRLRKGVKFHNGEALDAHAVKATFDRMLDKELRPTTTLPRRIKLKRAEVADEHTVRILTRGPVPSMLAWMAAAWILPPRYYREHSRREVSRKPVGSGPYRLVEWVKDDHITMEANEAYWKGPPAVRKVIWRPVPEGGARMAELETGGADIIVNVSPDQMEILRRSPDVRVETIQGGRRVFIGIRTDKYPFGDRRVRQALNYAVDFAAIRRNLLGGMGRRMSSIVNPPHANPALKPYPYDPDRARKLFREAGLKDTDGDGFFDRGGKRLVIQLDTSAGRYLKDKEIAQAVASYLGKVGLAVEVIPLEWAVYTAKRYRKRDPAPLYLLGVSSGFRAELDLGVLQKNIFINLTRWDHPEFEEKFALLRRTFDPARRRELSFRLQEIVREEAPWIFLWMQYDIYGVARRIRWKPRPDERIYLYHIRYAERPGA